MTVKLNYLGLDRLGWRKGFPLPGLGMEWETVPGTSAVTDNMTFILLLSIP